MGDEEPFTLTERQQYWLDHITCCDTTGRSSKDYAAENGLSVQAMYAARKALVARGALKAGGRGLRSKPSRRFARVVPSAPPAGARAPASPCATWMQVHLTNGTVIHFPEPLDAESLRLVLQSAATRP